MAVWGMADCKHHGNSRERNLGPMMLYALQELEEQVRAALPNQRSGFVRKRNLWNSGIYISLFS